MKKTSNIGLPLYEAGEMPAHMGDWNSTMQTIDDNIGGGELIINELFDTRKYQTIHVGSFDFNSAPAGSMPNLFVIADLSNDDRLSDSDTLYLKWRLINRNNDPSIDSDNSIITARTSRGSGDSIQHANFMQSFGACTNNYPNSYCDSPFLRITKNTVIECSFYKHHSNSFLSIEITVFKKL